jgi:hypothetical protein
MPPRHEFVVGENIRYRERNLHRTTSHRYCVVSYRPDEDGEPCYLIKCEEEKYERIAVESELRRV